MEIFNHLQKITTFPKAKEFLSSLCEITQNIERAIVCAQINHEGQFRKTGEPYIVHPLCVACLVAFYGGDEAMICAALLHDVVEDTSYNLDNVKSEFGEAVATLVDALTKIDAIRREELDSNTNQRMAIAALTFRKMLISAVDDPRVLVIKISDRLHNMLTLGGLSEEKRVRIAKETLVVYAPIAHRLGISSIKNELEDKSFYYIFPDEYKKIQDYLKSNNQSLVLKLNDFACKLKALMLKNGFDESCFKIESRIKRSYSIYLKMQRKGIGIDEILDLLAIRILVNTPLECYRMLGIIHLEFKPIVSRFKDYIALPKENAYQTIHTTIFDKSLVFEVQIRTFSMHQNAEFGVAAHWKYKNDGIMPSLNWLHSLQYQNNDIEEFYELAKNDLYREDIVVFSPKGSTFSLPVGAIALDYAYAVHSELGDKAKIAYINNQKASLLQTLKSGDIVRILTDEKEMPKYAWIDALKTSRAKNHLKTQRQNQIKEIQKLEAKNMLATIFSKDPNIFARYLSIQNLNFNFVRIVNDGTYLQEACTKIKQSFHLDGNNIFVRFRFNMLKLKEVRLENFAFLTNRSVNGVAFDYCCRPKYGDLVGAVLTNQKAIIHHKLCDKFKSMLKEKQPVVFVKWAQTNHKMIKVIVSLENKKGTLAAFLGVLAKEHCNIISATFNGQSLNGAVPYCEVVFEVENADKNLKNKLSDRFKIIEYTNYKDVYQE